MRAALVLTLVLLCGCGDPDGLRLYPVTGTVSLDGVPFKADNTTVLFKPDKTKGNNSPHDPLARVDPQGNYELVTKGRKGAPLGWYKVIVSAAQERQGDFRQPHTSRPTVTSLLPAQYGSPATTELAVEVVEAPQSGAYDLKLKK